MEYKNEHQRQLAILEAAIPYVPPNGRHAIKVLLQADAFFSLARGDESEDYSLEAAEMDFQTHMPTQSNLQNMLLRIQEFLTPKEADLVQTLLNFLNAGKLLHNYQDFIKHYPIPSETTDNSAPRENNNDTKNPLKDFLISQLNPEQKTAFEQLQNIMYNEQELTHE